MFVDRSGLASAARNEARQWGAHIYISNFEHSITRHLPTSTFWGTDMRPGPLFMVDDPDATTLDTMVINQGRCEPGFALKEHGEWAMRLLDRAESAARSAARTGPPCRRSYFGESEAVMSCGR